MRDSAQELSLRISVDHPRVGVPDAEALLPTRATALGAPANLVRCGAHRDARAFLSPVLNRKQGNVPAAERRKLGKMTDGPSSNRHSILMSRQPLVQADCRDEAAGFDPVEAATAEETLRGLAIAAHDFAAVVSDIEMPGEMNGLELAWAIRAQWPKIAVVLTSGRQLPRPVDMPQRKSGFVAKPYHPAHLVQIVTEATS